LLISGFAIKLVSYQRRFVVPPALDSGYGKKIDRRKAFRNRLSQLKARLSELKIGLSADDGGLEQDTRFALLRHSERQASRALPGLD